MNFSLTYKMVEPEPEPLAMYVVYENPSDYPGKFVVRRWDVATVVKIHLIPLIVTDTLDEARDVIPDHLYNLGRDDHDDPAIYEVWV